VTNRRRSEAALAELAHINRVSTLEEMAASLAHEVKQPIAAAITSANSCVEWLAHEPPNLDRARVAATRIDKYGNRATEIIERIRSLYKKSPPQRELVDVNGIIEEMLTLLNGEANRYSVAMRTDLAADVPKIMVDRVQLQPQIDSRALTRAPQERALPVPKPPPCLSIVHDREADARVSG
jgi:C4-dicarboxylate-specific signal transduction histidine kinase